MTQHAWNSENVAALYALPMIDLLHRAQCCHREHFDPNQVELTALLSVKTGTCPEDCAYCPQSAHYNTGVEKEAVMALDEVIEKAKEAKARGVKRFCMAAAWRTPPKKDFPKMLAMVTAVKELGLETCVTLGMLDGEQAQALKSAGLDYYNHNLDSSEEFYNKIITTRSYQDRLDTLENVRNADINVCCGGILGMGETREDRINFLLALAQLPKSPESIPINRLIAVKGTPLEDAPLLDNMEFIRTVAAARIMFPTARVRLSAGREKMSAEMQLLCFMAGANSIVFGEKLLTTQNNDFNQDAKMFATLGIQTTEALA